MATGRRQRRKEDGKKGRTSREEEPFPGHNAVLLGNLRDGLVEDLVLCLPELLLTLNPLLLLSPHWRVLLDPGAALLEALAEGKTILLEGGIEGVARVELLSGLAGGGTALGANPNPGSEVVIVGGGLEGGQKLVYGGVGDGTNELCGWTGEGGESVNRERRWGGAGVRLRGKARTVSEVYGGI